ncbi:MAG: hypothetical protein K0U59_09965 [Gammaproteobacteria bacterium]|nr:hypothetical protein [Gammaproteobacteria bacterium]
MAEPFCVEELEAVLVVCDLGCPDWLLGSLGLLVDEDDCAEELDGALLEGCAGDWD